MSDSSSETFVTTVKDNDEEYNGYKYNDKGCGCFALFPLIITLISLLLLLVIITI